MGHHQNVTSALQETVKRMKNKPQHRTKALLVSDKGLVTEYIKNAPLKEKKF